MKFEGTPGPWYWEGDVLGNKYVIAGGRDWVFSSEDKALIAAAPELLKALQEMVAIVKKNSHPQPDKPFSNYARAEYAESVIAKAIGKEK